MELKKEDSRVRGRERAERGITREREEGGEGERGGWGGRKRER